METTIRNETALHIAVKKQRFGAFDVMIGRLRRTLHKGSFDLESKILGMKDDDGNTLLHIAAHTNQPEVIKVVLNCRPKVKINEKNSEGLTVLDILLLQFPAHNAMSKMLRRAGALPGTSIPDRNHRINSKMSFFEQKIIDIIRHKTNMSESSLNVVVVIMVLIATVTYQSSLSPPGGVWQDSGNGSNTTGTNIGSLTHQTGTSIMTSLRFIVFCFLNFITRVAAFVTVLFLLPKDLGSRILHMPLYLFVYCFAFSMSVISPTPIISETAVHPVFLFFVSSILAPWSSAVVFRKLPVFMIDQS